jgi:hypothetical protein
MWMHPETFSAVAGTTFVLIAAIARWMHMPNAFAVAAALAAWSFIAAIGFAIARIF